jgi:adenylylsulfate kinase
MYEETNTRSIVKGSSRRFLATSTTIIIVYVFFKRLDQAIAAGSIRQFKT